MHVYVTLFFFRCGHTQEVVLPCEDANCNDKFTVRQYNFDNTCGACAPRETPIVVSFPDASHELRRRIIKKEAHYKHPRCEFNDIYQIRRENRTPTLRATVIWPSGKLANQFRLNRRSPLSFEDLQNARRNFRLVYKDERKQTLLRRLEFEETRVAIAEATGRAWRQMGLRVREVHVTSPYNKYLIDCEDMLSGTLYREVDPKTLPRGAICPICHGKLAGRHTIRFEDLCIGGTPVSLPCSDDHIFGLGCINKSFRLSGPRCPLDWMKFDVVWLDVGAEIAGKLLPEIKELELFDYGSRISAKQGIVYALKACLLLMLSPPLVFHLNRFVEVDDSHMYSLMSWLVFALFVLATILGALLLWI